MAEKARSEECLEGKAGVKCLVPLPPNLDLQRQHNRLRNDLKCYQEHLNRILSPKRSESPKLEEQEVNEEAFEEAESLLEQRQCLPNQSHRRHRSILHHLP